MFLKRQLVLYSESSVFLQLRVRLPQKWVRKIWLVISTGRLVVFKINQLIPELFTTPKFQAPSPQAHLTPHLIPGDLAPKGHSSWRGASQL